MEVDLCDLNNRDNQGHRPELNWHSMEPMDKLYAKFHFDNCYSETCLELPPQMASKSGLNRQVPDKLGLYGIQW